MKNYVKELLFPQYAMQNTKGKMEQTKFEKQVKQLGIEPEQYTVSPELSAWVRRNWQTYYVPEWLLQKLGLSADRKPVSLTYGQQFARTA